MTPSSPHRPPPDRRVAGRPDARRLRAAAGRRLVALVTVVGLATACATSTGRPPADRDVDRDADRVRHRGPDRRPVPDRRRCSHVDEAARDALAAG